DPADVVAHASNVSFDAATFELWAPLLNGACLAVIHQNALLDPKRFGEALKLSRITVLWLTVGLFTQYAEVLREEFVRFRFLLVGADNLNVRVHARVFVKAL